MADLDAELTELLRDMRHEAGLTQRQLAERLGWTVGANHRSNVSHYEVGDKIPKPELIGRWAAACGFHAELVVYSGADVTITPHGVGEWVAVVELGGDRDG